MNRRAATLILASAFLCGFLPPTNAQFGALAGPRKLQPGGPMQVILLGTGIPVPNPMRATAATLVIAGDKAMLVDTGRGCVVRLSEARIGNVSAVLFTHYHSDHIAGFGDLLVSRGIAGAENPLPVIGPPGARRVVDGFRMAYSLDESYRAAHHGKYWGSAGTKTKVTEAEPGVVYEADGLKVTMFKVNHAPIDPAVGYRFDYQDKVVVVSGDTIKTEKMIARDAEVKKLVLTHLVPSIPQQEAAEKNFVRGMSDIYAGPILVGRDGMTIDIE